MEKKSSFDGELSWGAGVERKVAGHGFSLKAGWANALGWVNGAILAGLMALFAASGHGTAMSVVPGADADLLALESAVAAEPSEANVGALATTYLANGQPGLAQSAIDAAPAEVRQTAAVTLLEAHARLALGQPEAALAALEEGARRCDDRGCGALTQARLEGQRRFVAELVRMGIDDPAASPDRTRLAFRRSARHVRLAMR